MKVFYHNDLDGKCSANIVYSQYHDNDKENDRYITCVEMNYSKPWDIVNLIDVDELVYFVDLSISETNLEEINKVLNKTSNVIWIDHHKTTFETIDKHPELLHKFKDSVFQNGVSGCMLTWQYIHDTQYTPYIIKRISDFDTWKHEYGQENNFNLIYGFETINYEYNSPEWDKFDYKCYDTPDDFTQSLIDKGQGISIYLSSIYDNLIQAGYETEICGYTCFAINTQLYGSQTFKNKIDEYDVIMRIAFDGEIYNHSIYSNKDYVDCSCIAEEFGGGGHKGASGFTTNALVFTNSNY